MDRAVDYAYQARMRFADQRVFLTGEIIHNPHVNEKLRASGIRFLCDPGEPTPPLGPGDVVIIPAFGVTVSELARLQALGCTLVDTTCGSVLNVWKNVLRYARDGFTALIHGKVQSRRDPGDRLAGAEDAGWPLPRRPRQGRGRRRLRLHPPRRRPRRLPRALRPCRVSAGFDPDRDLVRVGVANQTTMLMSESLEIADMVGEAMTDRYGADARWPRTYRAFDTICSATQERQDAVCRCSTPSRST